MQKHNLQNSLMKKIIGVMLTFFFVTSIPVHAKTDILTLTIKTANGKNSKTDDYLYFTVLGALNDTREFKLDKPKYNDFERNQTDTYSVTTNVDLGDIIGVRVRLSGSDGWQIGYIKVSKKGISKVETFFSGQNMWVDDTKQDSGRLKTVEDTHVINVVRQWDSCNPNGSWNGSTAYNATELGQQSAGQYKTAFHSIIRNKVSVGGVDTKNVETTNKKSIKVNVSAEASYGVMSASVDVEAKLYNKVITQTGSSREYSNGSFEERGVSHKLDIPKEGRYWLLRQSDHRAGYIKIGNDDPKYIRFEQYGTIEPSLMIDADYNDYIKKKCHVNNL
jgi:hypothetical protein